MNQRNIRLLRVDYVDEESTSLHIYHVLQKDIIICLQNIKKDLYEKQSTNISKTLYTENPTYGYFIVGVFVRYISLLIA